VRQETVRTASHRLPPDEDFARLDLERRRLARLNFGCGSVLALLEDFAPTPVAFSAAK